MDIKGNYTALVTPFLHNQEVDYITLKNLTKFQIDNKTDGIVALGSTAESPTLTEEEKHKIMQTIVKEAKNKVPIIAGVNAFSLSDALYQADQRYLDGASALLVSPPPYIKATESGLYNYFSSIANNSPIPIILYNIPSRTGVNLSVNLLYDLSKNTNIIGLKEASGDLNYTLDIAHFTKNNNFTLIAGNDNLLLPLLSAGATAIISVVGNIDPEICRNVINLYSEGKPKQAAKTYNDYYKLIDALSVESNPIPVKYLMAELNMIKPYYRAPLCPPTPKNRQILEQLAIEYSFEKE